MINFANRTQYSFRTATGSLDEVIAANPDKIVGICDRVSTWGHLDFIKACKKSDKTPVLGVEIGTVMNCDERSKQPFSYTRLFAKNADGLKELHEITSLATEKFYYVPRIDWGVVGQVSDNLIVVLGAYWDESNADDYLARDNFYVALDSQCNTFYKRRIEELYRHKILACSHNYYPRPSDLKRHQVVIGMQNYEMRTSPSHIMNEEEWLDYFGHQFKDVLSRTESVFKDCHAEVPFAKMVSPVVDTTLKNMCIEGAILRGIDLEDKVYAKRLKRELDLIDTKKFEDYFYVVADLVQYAKTKMFVGPARGSSCGSLVCYLIGITDIDPMPYDLLFERFIDINREDYPDIDIDFEDTKREMLFKYLAKKYGADCVAKLGTVSMLKAKSAITDVSKCLSIPAWEVSDLKNAIIERSTGDSRAGFCLLDTLEQLDVGKNTLAKYPELEIAASVEGHARHTGVHAAGIIVTADPISKYCAVDEKAGCAMIDKYNAEKIGLLKIDVLGLRTLSVLQDSIDQVGMSREQLKAWPLDDQGAFDVLNKGHFAGVFQFEGNALQSLCKQITVSCFDDMACLTALGRPGPLSSGGTAEYIKRKLGLSKITNIHSSVDEITDSTLGIIVYQEQVMQIARKVGKLSWEDVSNLRKAMSKSLGKEFFNTFWVRFEAGAKENGIDSDEAKVIWDNINTMGSWAFNRSHAVAYGMISYWCCVMKANHPLEFAAACLRNAKDDDQSIKILRELSHEGFGYLPYHKDKSLSNWSVQDGKLVGGLVGIKGVGDKLAADILKRRESGEYTLRQNNLLTSGTTAWDDIWEGKNKWGHIIENPHKYNVTSKISLIDEIALDAEGEFVVIAKMTDKNLRCHNELILVEKRGGREMTGQTLFLKLVLEDDTGMLNGTIDRYKYLKTGKNIVETGKVGDWYLLKGKKRADWSQIFIDRIIKLTGCSRYNKPQ